jgi:protocatechuate 3,4-dioxygenase beta subunit
MSLPRVVAAPALRALRLLITLLALLALLALPDASATAQSTSQGDSAGTNISGSVYDSLAGKPLAGALVQLVASGENIDLGARSATTGANGEFELSGIRHGKYLIGFLHPALDSLGLGVPPRLLDVSDSTPAHIALAIPSAPTVRSQLCSQPQPDDSTGLVLGFIRDADSGIPLGEASVVVMWTEIVLQDGIRTERRQVPVKSNSEGWYALCGVPTEGAITALAESGGDASGYIEITVAPRGLLHRDFSIPRGSAAIVVADTADSSASEPVRRGTARLTGEVRNEHGKPLAGAQLMVWGSGITGSAGDDGRFSLSTLPAGTQALEVRYVGYAPKRVTVDLVSNQTRSVAVTLDEVAEVLDGVVVYGKPNRRRRDLTGFLERRSRGFGYFITRADIEKRNPFQFTDLMRQVPGFRVMAGTGLNYSILSTRGTGLKGPCTPQVYLDGVQLVDAEDLNLMVNTSDIVGVEAYAGPSESPPQYTNGGCGSILIWTGPNLDAAKN